MGRRKNLTPVQRARMNLSFNLSDPSQRHVYNYLSKQKGNITQIITNAILRSTDESTDDAADSRKVPIRTVTKPRPIILREEAHDSREFDTPVGEYMQISDSDFDDLDDALSAFGDA